MPIWAKHRLIRAKTQRSPGCQALLVSKVCGYGPYLIGATTRGEKVSEDGSTMGVFRSGSTGESPARNKSEEGGYL